MAPEVSSSFTPLSAEKTSWIRDWISSASSSTTASAADKEPSGPARPLKRACPLGCRDSTRFVHPFHVPDTPPPTEPAMPDTPTRTSFPRSEASSTYTNAQKRRAAHDGLDGDPTPRARTRTSIPQLSPTKSRLSRPSSSPVKKMTMASLAQLEKPIKQWPLSDLREAGSPSDAQALYRALTPVSRGKGIIPSAVRERVLALIDKEELDPYNFRPTFYPDGGLEGAGMEAKADASSTTATNASLLHDGICRILRRGSAVQETVHECGWNHIIHSAVLELVYELSKPGVDPNAEPQPWSEPHPARARVVHAMSTTILQCYRPRLSSGQVVNYGDDVADSASATTNTTNDSAGFFPVVGQGRSDSRKVDYVLALDVTKGSPLSIVFHKFLEAEPFDRGGIEKGILPHVNQTDYAPVRWSPVFCSVETKLKTNDVDGLVQLSVWLAAWHKRLDAARQYILATRPDLRPRPDRLPSALLIEVVCHEWQLYIACPASEVGVTGERFATIKLHGPMTIGSTKDAYGLYQLVTSLQIIKRWGETTFQGQLEEWLLAEPVCRSLPVR